MSTTVTSTATFGMDAFASLAVVTSANDTRGTITFTSAAPNSDRPSFTAKLQAKTFGPFLAPMTVSIVVEDGSCTYQLTGNTGGYSYDANNNVTGLVGPDGDEAVRLDSEPADWMRQQGGVGEIASAMSTTVALTQAIPVASTRVRVAWQGRGSAGAVAGTDRLYIAANEDNAVAGLVASQDARRRQYILAPGEAVVLKSKAPISVLHFSANASITASTHSIQTTYEEAAA